MIKFVRVRCTTLYHKVCQGEVYYIIMDFLAFVPSQESEWSYTCVLRYRFIFFFYFSIVYLFVYLMVFNTTFDNISVIWWRSVLLVEETGSH